MSKFNKEFYKQSRRLNTFYAQALHDSVDVQYVHKLLN